MIFTKQPTYHLHPYFEIPQGQKPTLPTEKRKKKTSEEMKREEKRGHFYKVSLFFTYHKLFI